LWEETDFLLDVFSKEFIYQKELKRSDLFNYTLSKMIERKILSFADEK